MTEANIVDQLEQIFRVVIERARSDQAFAKQLFKAIGAGGLSSTAVPKKSWDTLAPDATLNSDMDADQIRSTLGALTRDQIYALVKTRALSPNRTSSFNKTQLIEHVVRHFRNLTESTKRKLEY